MKRIVLFLFCLTLLTATSNADDLKNQKLLDLLDRLAGERNPRSFGTRRFYSINDKQQITEIRFQGVKLKTGDLKVITELQHVETVDLSDTNLEDAQVAHLQKLESLRSLDLFQTKITGKGLSHLRMMVQLEELNVGRTRIDDDSLKVCATLPNLRRLGLHGCKIDGSGFRHLADLKKLEVIKVGNTRVSDATVPMLGKIQSLKGVQLDGTKVSSKTLSELAKSTGLQWMASSKSTVDELIHRMEKGDFQRVNDMTTIGLIIPNRKTYKRIKVSELEKNARDKKIGCQRYLIELRWEEEGKKPIKFRATVAVDRGTVQIHEMGIVDLEDE